MEVPYFDLKMQYRVLRDEILAVVDRVCHNASFILGEEVAKFEEEFAAYCEARHCVAVNSGTSALHLALLGVGVGAGDEVITTPNTFIATAEAISYTGARPVFVDIDPATANIDPKGIAAAITPRTKAILPVHLYGRPADMDAILDIAGRHGLAVIEDACQAHGARWQGRRVGGIGQAGAFSFYPGKNLGAYGEGGALVTNDDQLARLARSLRAHGEPTRYVHERIGYNYRMDGLQGAVLRIKLRRLNEWNARRQALAQLYRTAWAQAGIEMPADDPRGECAYHLFVVYVNDRDRIREELGARGIGTAVHYPRALHEQQAYAHLGYASGNFPHTERACQRVISLPLFPEMTDGQAEYVIAAVSRSATAY